MIAHSSAAQQHATLAGIETYHTPDSESHSLSNSSWSDCVSSSVTASGSSESIVSDFLYIAVLFLLEYVQFDSVA